MEVRALDYADGRLRLLDQTGLPAQETWLELTRAHEVADAIRRLAVRGAPAIGLAAAYGLAIEARHGGDVEQAAELLAATRPTAVNLRWALDRALEEAGTDPAALERFAVELHAAQLDQDRRIGAHGAKLFEPGDRVLTHCNTGALATGGLGTACAVIANAHRQGRVEHVWVDETRPLLQGSRLTAYELERAGVPFAVVVDGAAGALMARREVDRVIVGADRIAANGDVANKIGTYSIAVLAAHHDIPFYVAAPRSTIDPHTPDGEAIVIEERAPEEVTDGAPARNLAFDVTPAVLVAGIVTEDGVLEPAAVAG